MKLFFVIWTACTVANVSRLTNQPSYGILTFTLGSESKSDVKPAEVTCAPNIVAFNDLDAAVSFADHRKYQTDITSGTAKVYRLAEVK